MTIENSQNYPIEHNPSTDIDSIDISALDKEGIMDYLQTKADKETLKCLLSEVFNDPIKNQIQDILVKKFPEDIEITDNLYIEDSEKGVEAVKGFLATNPSVEAVKELYEKIKDQIHIIVYSYNSDYSFLGTSAQELRKYILENKGGDEDLFYLLGDTANLEVSNAISELLDKPLTNEQLNTIIMNCGNGAYKEVKSVREKACEKLLAQNPTNDELVSIIWGSKNFTPVALDLLLKNKPTSEQLTHVFTSLPYGGTIELVSDRIPEMWEAYINSIPKPSRNELFGLVFNNVKGISERALDEFLKQSPTENELMELISKYYGGGKHEIFNYVLTLENPSYELCSIALKYLEDPNQEIKLQQLIKKTSGYKAKEIANILGVSNRRR